MKIVKGKYPQIKLHRLIGNHRLRANSWDLFAIPLVFGLIVYIGFSVIQMGKFDQSFFNNEIRLDWFSLIEYGMRTSFRMAIGLVASIIVSIAVATLAAKSRRMGKILIPLIDVLQSVPVLSYVAFTFTFLLIVFPHSLIGAELAAIFAIFTAQVWNMAFSVYRSLINIPTELKEAALVFRLSPWQRFWRLEMPYAMPGFVWNIMVSMSNGWFYITAAESITIADKSISLPGMGSYISTALVAQDSSAIMAAIITMLVMIIIYDQLLFRPLLVWAEKFAFQEQASESRPKSWVWDIFRRTALFKRLETPFEKSLRKLRQYYAIKQSESPSLPKRRAISETRKNQIFYSTVAIMIAVAVFYILSYALKSMDLREFLHIIKLGVYTSMRILVMVLLALIIWVPLGVYIGLRPKLALALQPITQIFAAFPANLYFPLFAAMVLANQLNPNIWLSFLLIFGSQWYMLYNVVAGTFAIPQDLRDVAKSYQLPTWLWWRRVIFPATLPYIITGVTTTAGGAWNATIIAEVVNWGDQKLVAEGLGSYISIASEQGNLPHVLMATLTMASFVIALNFLVWRPLYAYSAKKLHVN